MKRSPLLFSLVGVGLALAPLPVEAQDQLSRKTASPVLAHQTVVYLDLQTTTWRSRGRISYGIGPSLRMKLAAAGFTVTQDQATPRELTIKVDYREERGKPVSVSLFGTDITCTVTLEHPEGGRLLDLKIHESPTYAELVTAPYLDVVERFQTNPYFYFLGDLIRGRIDAHLDTTGALIQALERQLESERPRVVSPLDTLPSPADTFPDPDIFYAAAARENAIEELGRLKDPRAVGILTKLTIHSDSQVRLRAVMALGKLGTPSARPTIEHVVQSDSDAKVRDAAAAVLPRFTGP